MGCRGWATPSAARSRLLVYARLGPRIRELIPEGHSLTEYAHARYGTAMYARPARRALYMFIFLAAEMTGIAGALALVADVPLWQTSLLIGGFVLVYTAYGGLLASIVTDTVQTLVILPLLAVGFGGALLSLGGTASSTRRWCRPTRRCRTPDSAPASSSGCTWPSPFWCGLPIRASAAGVRRRRCGASVAAAIDAVVVVPMLLLYGLFGIAAAG